MAVNKKSQDEELGNGGGAQSNGDGAQSNKVEPSCEAVKSTSTGECVLNCIVL